MILVVQKKTKKKTPLNTKPQLLPFLGEGWGCRYEELAIRFQTWVYFFPHIINTFGDLKSAAAKATAVLQFLPTVKLNVSESL